jgi:glutamine amidotransferase
MTPMCRLFGMTAGALDVAATCWLLDAPTSLLLQSHREPDGTGLGWFDEDGVAHVEKRPIAAHEDLNFALQARERRSPTFIAHIRFATTGTLGDLNTHPFEQDGRLLAHNGVIGDLDRLDRELGDHLRLVRGQTDSERYFALVTRYAEAAGGDVGEGIARAARWIADELPLVSLNMILVTAGEMWALRYPEINSLFVLERGAGGPSGDRHLEQTSFVGTVRVRCAELSDAEAVVVASERMDEDPGWREVEPGHLLHVDRDLTVHSTQVVDHPPRHPIALEPTADAA